MSAEQGAIGLSKSTTLEVLKDDFVEDDVVELKGQVQVIFHVSHASLDVLVHLTFIGVRLAAMVDQAFVQFLVLGFS